MKKNYKSKIIKNNKGQGVMEYMILTTLIGVFCLVAVKQFGEVVKERITKAKSHITKHIDLP